MSSACTSSVSRDTIWGFGWIAGTAGLVEPECGVGIGPLERRWGVAPFRVCSSAVLAWLLPPPIAERGAAASPPTWGGGGVKAKGEYVDGDLLLGVSADCM